MTKRQTTRSNPRRASQKQSNIPLWAWLAGGGILVVLLVAGLFYLGNRGPTAGIEGVEIFSDPGQGHQDGDISYIRDVPVGGIHNPQWLNCGIYDQPVRAENVVHSMEHGAVWIAYQPELPAGQVEVLRSLVRQNQTDTGARWIVLAPKPGLADPIVATAWRVQLRLADAADERLIQFVETYRQGPYHPEPGADCTFGGIGEPLS